MGCFWRLSIRGSHLEAQIGHIRKACAFPLVKLTILRILPDFISVSSIYTTSFNKSNFWGDAVKMASITDNNKIKLEKAGLEAVKDSTKYEHEETLVKSIITEGDIDAFGSHKKKTDPAEIALVRKLDMWIMVSYFSQPSFSMCMPLHPFTPSSFH